MWNMRVIRASMIIQRSTSVDYSRYLTVIILLTLMISSIVTLLVLADIQKYFIYGIALIVLFVGLTWCSFTILQTRKWKKEKLRQQQSLRSHLEVPLVQQPEPIDSNPARPQPHPNHQQALRPCSHHPRIPPSPISAPIAPPIRFVEIPLYSTDDLDRRPQVHYFERDSTTLSLHSHCSTLPPTYDTVMIDDALPTYADCLEAGLVPRVYGNCTNAVYLPYYNGHMDMTFNR